MKRYGLVYLCLVAMFCIFASNPAYTATFTVDNLGDLDNGDPYTVGDNTNTLRKCIRLANTTPGADTISFSVSGTISPASALPVITDNETIIDASSRWDGAWPGGQPGITLDGSNAGDGVTGLEIAGADNCHIRGLFITHFNNVGVRIRDGAKFNTIGGPGAGYRNVISGNDNCGLSIWGGADNNNISGNYIGTDVTGTIALGNSSCGVGIMSKSNIIGGTTPGERNIISGNKSSGVIIHNPGANYNKVIGNYIGTDFNGTAALGNLAFGVGIRGEAQSNIIGGTTAGERNIISGNNGPGVQILGEGTDSNRVSGNYIGTDVTGTADLGNSGPGIEIREGYGQGERGAQSNIIGGTTPGERNIISGNDGSGVSIGGEGTENNIVSGNYIGTDVNGTAVLGNSEHGAAIWDKARSNIIGGTTPGERNIISGNDGTGVVIAGEGTENNVVSGNYIGTDATGTADLGNSVHGVAVYPGPNSNTIGGTTAGERNIISGNNGYGVFITGEGTDNNKVSGNYIGTDVNGTADLGNSTRGVVVDAGAQSNIIGGTTAGERNIISGNEDVGVGIAGEGTDNNRISGNYIGTDVNGTAYLGNSGGGAAIWDKAKSNTIGGTTPGERNIISGNGGNGVVINGEGTENNIVSGNYIGTDVNGTADLGNSANGVNVGSANSNTIGGATPGERNIISGNDGNGVAIFGEGADNNKVSGNYIGTDVTGTADLGNSGGGAGIWDKARSNIIGGTTPGERNIISGNDWNGVTIGGEGADNNVVSGNYIGTDVTGTADLGNSANGAWIRDKAKSNIIGGTTPGERNIISGNKRYGVEIGSEGTDNNVVSGNYIGTDVTGTADLGNSVHGVVVDTGASNTIGGTTPGERNIISGNEAHGVFIGGEGADNNRVSGNYIGTDVNGTADLGNSGGGTGIWDKAKSNIIGGTTPGERNIISGNDGNGVSIGGEGTDNNIVSGNYIGTDVTGTADLGNSVHGVGIYSGAQSNIIGGTTKPERNIISGNDDNGVKITNKNTNNNKVSANFIGTDFSGYVDLGNSNCGVLIDDEAQWNTIGGTIFSNERNIISGNDQYGVIISSNNNKVSGNYIGINATGAVGLGNRKNGVSIREGGQSNVIGGSTEERNVISGNGGGGISIQDSETTSNKVSGNYIGTSASGTADLGNSGNGVAVYTGAASNIIGGTTPGERNIISGNDGSGVSIGGEGTENNRVSGNYIGTDVTGAIDLGNSNDGILVDGGAQSNIIGGTTPGERNIISGNDGWGGMHIVGSNTTQNVVSGNYIGTNASGTAVLGNSWNGVDIWEAQSNIIGGDRTKGEGNLISGNGGEEGGNGVKIDGVAVASNNIVSGNYIGTDASGTIALGNLEHGVSVGGQLNIIGGETPGERNIISGNRFCGVAPGTNNMVLGNYIGTDVSGNSNLGNFWDGVCISKGGNSNTISKNIIAFNRESGARVTGNGSNHNKISRNSIHHNGALGIYLENGGNDEIPAPAIASTGLTDSILVISGTGAGAGAAVEAFEADSPSSEGMIYLGSVVAFESGNFSGSVNVAGKGLAVGDPLVVTTTHTDNNTSEFSVAVIVSAAPPFQQCMMGEGWNLITLPVNKCFYEGTAPTDQPPCVQLVNIVTLGFSSMAEWFSSVLAPGDAWMVVIGVNGAMDSSLPSIFHTLKCISSISGYWVKIGEGTGGAVMTIAGSAYDPACIISLAGGWNLAGYPITTGYYDTDPQPVVPGVTNWVKVNPPVAAYVFKSIEDKYEIIIGENGAYDPSLPWFFSSLHYITPYSAHWIKMKEAADLDYSQMGSVKSVSATNRER